MTKDENVWGNMAQLRMAAESLADAIEIRVKVHNRIRSGSADAFIMTSAGELLQITGQPTERQISKAVLGEAVLNFENTARDNLQSIYTSEVPRKVREWAASVPILRSGELFPRIVGLVGNPCHAIPLRIEGEGKNRRAIPDGEPYDRTIGQLWQYCGRGNPDHEVVKGDQASLLAGGKIRTVTPLLYAFSRQLVMGSANSADIRDAQLYKVYRREQARMRGHEGDCDPGGFPTKCSVSHRRHYKVCRNHKPPWYTPDGCGISAHPEWGEPGTPWRPGHINMHAHRVVQKTLLKEFWIVADGTDW